MSSCVWGEGVSDNRFSMMLQSVGLGCGGGGAAAATAAAAGGGDDDEEEEEEEKDARSYGDYH